MTEPSPIRKRMKRWEGTGSSRFITFSTYRRLPALLVPGVAEVFEGALEDARRRWGFRLFAWVMMPEHVHLLLRPMHEQPLAPLLQGLKVAVAKRAGPHLSHAAPEVVAGMLTPAGRYRLWQPGGGFDRNVRDADEFDREVAYIHHNPVTRELVSAPEEWPWSSARWWMGIGDPHVQCDVRRKSCH